MKNKTGNNDNNSYQTTNSSGLPPLLLTMEETARRLGISIRTLHELRNGHPLYAPDGSKALKEQPKRDSPLWSDDLVRLIAFARTKTPQGVRQLTDDQALQVRKGMGESKRAEYLSFIAED